MPISHSLKNDNQFANPKIIKRASGPAVGGTVHVEAPNSEDPADFPAPLHSLHLLRVDQLFDARGNALLEHGSLVGMQRTKIYETSATVDGSNSSTDPPPPFFFSFVVARDRILVLGFK